MRRNVLLGASILAVSLGVYVANRGSAGESEANAAIVKLAAAVKKGDKDAVAKEAAAIAKKYDLEEVMDAFKLRKKGGVGVGSPAGSITPDGIDLKLQSLGRDAPSPNALAKEAAALEEMGYVIIAVAEVAKAKAPTADKGKKTKKDWNQWSADMHDGAAKVIEAAKSKGSAEIKAAAAKTVAACNNCHSVFK